MKTTPCPSCPWRVGSSARDIPEFSIEKARRLRCTVGSGDQFRTIMACHGSPEGGESTCIGYVAVEGWSNLAVRLQAMNGKIDIGGIIRDSEGIEMFPSFDAMLANLEETVDVYD